MTEPKQRTLSGYKSKVHTQEDFKNPNEGKPLLNDSDEYIFKLIKEPHIIQRPQKKKNKEGVETTITVDKAVCEFEEKATKNIVAVFFRVDSLNFANTPEEEPFESAVVKFFKKIKSPLPEDTELELGKYLVVGMRFRSRVVVKIEKDPEGNTITRYFMDIPTVRKLLPADTAGEDFDKHPDSIAPQTSTETPTNAFLLANAKYAAHGAANMGDALQRLADAQVSSECIQALIDANGKQLLTFPL
jgi:hypothetical protein